jgi:hypothetical protein
MSTTLLENLDPSTQMMIGEFRHKEGDRFAYVQLSMPILHIPEPLTSKYGVNPNFEDNGRYPLELSITPEIEERILKIEDFIQKMFSDYSRHWFKKDKTKDKFVFSNMLRATEEGTVLKVKVNKNNTMMKILSEDATTILTKEEGTIAHLNRHCKVFPFLQSYSLWIDTQKRTYGVSLAAKILLVQPGLQEDAFESMLLSAGYTYESE